MQDFLQIGGKEILQAGYEGTEIIHHLFSGVLEMKYTICMRMSVDKHLPDF